MSAAGSAGAPTGGTARPCPHYSCRAAGSASVCSPREPQRPAVRGQSPPHPARPGQSYTTRELQNYISRRAAERGGHGRAGLGAAPEAQEAREVRESGARPSQPIPARSSPARQVRAAGALRGWGWGWGRARLGRFPAGEGCERCPGGERSSGFPCGEGKRFSKRSRVSQPPWQCRGCKERAVPRASPTTGVVRVGITQWDFVWIWGTGRP